MRLVSLDCVWRHIEIVILTKVLELTLTDDLKWIKHERTVVDKASKWLFLLKPMWAADVKEKHLIEFYTIERSVLECACEVFHSNPTYLSDDLERIQRCAMRIIFLGMKH